MGDALVSVASRVRSTDPVPGSTAIMGTEIVVLSTVLKVYVPNVILLVVVESIRRVVSRVKVLAFTINEVKLVSNVLVTVLRTVMVTKTSREVGKTRVVRSSRVEVVVVNEVVGMVTLRVVMTAEL